MATILIETSALPAFLNQQPPEYTAYVKEAAATAAREQAKFALTSYVRMEACRAWALDYIEFACTIHHFGQLDNAIKYVREEFHARKLKSYLTALSHLIATRNINSASMAAEELCRLAVDLIRMLDSVADTINNRLAKCSRGTLRINVDYNNLFDSCRAWYQDFSRRDHECDIATVVHGHAATADLLARIGDSDTDSSIKNLRKFRDKSTELDCFRCGKIGDAVIALEHDGSEVLLHVDGSFNQLCKARDKHHKQVLSSRAFLKLNEVQKPLQGDKD